MQVPSARLRYDSLSAHTDQARFLGSEAGNRTQSDILCGVTLALMGSSKGETEPRKVTYLGAGHRPTSRLYWSSFPPNFLFNIGKSPGNPVVKLAPPKGTINLTEGTKKNELRVKGKVEPFRRLDEQRNPLSSGRTDRNWSEVFRKHKLEQRMIRHNSNVSESWKTLSCQTSKLH